MALTFEQHVAVFNALQKEQIKAQKAYIAAKKIADNAPYEYGGSEEATIACVILDLRKAQYDAARYAVDAYFKNYLSV